MLNPGRVSNGEGRVAIVTGAARGIGLGIAQTLAEDGWSVLLADRDGGQAALEADALALRGRSARGVTLDVASAQDWTTVVALALDTWGRIDLLVNNAGISPRSTCETTDEALWDLTMGVNVKGAWLGTRACLPALRAAKGSVVNIGSTHATLPYPNLFAYSVSKAALLGLTRQVALECLPDEVTCNMIAPGWVASPGERAIQAAEGRADFPAGIRNMSSPEDVGAAVLYLASPAAHRVTGETLHLDGGLHAVGDARRVHFGG